MENPLENRAYITINILYTFVLLDGNSEKQYFRIPEFIVCKTQKLSRSVLNHIPAHVIHLVLMRSDGSRWNSTENDSQNRNK